MSAPDPEPKVPDIPSTARLAWLLFMQPIKLAELLHWWGLERTGQALVAPARARLLAGFRLLPQVR